MVGENYHCSHAGKNPCSSVGFLSYSSEGITTELNCVYRGVNKLGVNIIHLRLSVVKLVDKS